MMAIIVDKGELQVDALVMALNAQVAQRSVQGLSHNLQTIVAQKHLLAIDQQQ